FDRPGAPVDRPPVPPARSALASADADRPHHLVVLVLEDVAVPDVLARQVELRLNASHLVRIGDDGILATGLPGLRPAGIASEHLELHLMDVDGVGVVAEVGDLPDLGGAQGRILGDRGGPAEWYWLALGIEGPQQGLHRLDRGAVWMMRVLARLP